jgi:hypothetical protein
MKLLATALALLIAVFLAGSPAGAHRAKGSLEVREHVQESEGIYFEGYVSFLRLRDVDSGRLAIDRRFNGEVRLDTEVPLGHYRLIRFIKPCDANCDFLDPKTERCAIGVQVTADAPLRAVVRTTVGRPCEFRLRSGS